MGLCCNVLQGPNHTYSRDGHDKLMGFMNCTFPLAVMDSKMHIVDIFCT